MKMTVHGTKCEQMFVDVDVQSTATNFPRDAYLDEVVYKGKIVSWDPCRGGSGITKVEIENPTSEQLEALDVCERFLKLVERMERVERVERVK